MPVSFVEIDDPDFVGQRLDNFLLRELKGVPRTFIYRIIRKGEVRINGKRTKVDYRLSAKDIIRIPPVRLANREEPVVHKSTQRKVLALVQSPLYENDNILVINKPCGMAVHGGGSEEGGLVESLRIATANPKLGLAHRLDKETSGCLLLAKNRQTLLHVQEAFRNRQTKKIYQCIVWGKWPEKVKNVQLRLQRYSLANGERRVRVDSQGQASRSDFQIIHKSDSASWLQVRIHTGRTHQIRVHCSATGFPIVGDEKYCKPSQIKFGLPDSKQRQMCLHAAKLSIPDVDGSWIKVSAPIPTHFQESWSELIKVDSSIG